MTVNRWEITDSQGWQHCAEQRTDGRWVRHEDYAAGLRKLEDLAKTLAFALKGLYDDQVDYLTLNKLSGIDNHWMRASRIALADYVRETGGK